MTIERRRLNYESGWRDGAGGFDPAAHAEDDYARGYTDGRSAKLTSARAERDRLEHGRCMCAIFHEEINEWWGQDACPICGGTGREP